MTAKDFGKKLLPALTLAFAGVVVWFLFQIFSKVDWAKVGASLERISLEVLGLSLILVAANYLLLSTYDYMGFHYLRERPLEYKKVGPTALVSYAFNFNLGAFIGGLGFRTRIYSKWNVSKKLIPFVALFTVLTTWSGYIFLLSLVLVFFFPWLEGPYQPPQAAAFFAGVSGAALIALYLVLCARGYALKWKDRRFKFPRLSMGAAQILFACVQWSLAASVIYLFMRHLNVELAWGKVLYTYLVASIGGVVARIPAGLGVVEAVFIKFQPQLPAEDVLAAILCFRAVYYLLPLVLAVPGYIGIEYIQSRAKNKSTRSQRANEAY